MHIHFLGICGTFMGGLALLAKQMGYKVTGSDENVYPPMSSQLESVGIELVEGFSSSQLDIRPDQVVVGNVMTRGHDVIERMLDEQWPMISGPQWLSEHLLKNRWVLAVSGTHGKTTTASMLAWILECAGLEPGFLIGGVPHDFDVSARIGSKPFFVIEADEYDTAFFDKRSKFIHYQPRTLVINNIEFDHADIFRDLVDVQRQFHHVIKILPKEGKLIFNGDDKYIEDVMNLGFWSQKESFGINENSDWTLLKVHHHKKPYQFMLQGKKKYDGHLSLLGEHNAMNALAAIAAARHEFSGVNPSFEIMSLPLSAAIVAEASVEKAIRITTPVSLLRINSISAEVTSTKAISPESVKRFSNATSKTESVIGSPAALGNGQANKFRRSY